jgi:hypothetical protein
LIATLVASRGPTARDDSAPANAFSEGRARQVLNRLVGDGFPHPVGSAQNALVRDRVVAEFRAQGYEPIVERDFACSPGGSCGWVENVLAILPGREPGGTVILNAHYDSVPAGPGGGDDATGVAAILEVARAMRTMAPPRHSILFLIDDGEEAGLLGAEAFVRRHRPADYAFVLVLEARGSSGRTFMFETSPGNRAIVEAYARAVPRPSTSSVYFSIYERLPNSTNFTVFKRAGMLGMATAFIGDPAQYHTPLNRAENVPGRTIQHMGDTALGVARELADHILGANRDNAGYFDFLTLAVVRWPASLGVSIAALAFLSLAVLAAMQRRAGRFTGRALARALAFGLLPHVLAGLAGYAVYLLVSLRIHDSLWPATGNALVVAAWACGLAAVAFCAAIARGRVRSAEAWSAVWLVLALLGVCAAFLLPGAAYLFTLPAVVAVLIGGASWMRWKIADSLPAVVIPLAVIALLVFPFALELHDGMGAGTLFGTAILVACATAPLLPLLVEVGLPLRLALGSTAVMLGAAAVVFVAPVHSPEVPRPLSLVYQMERGARNAHWIAETAGASMPAGLQGAATWRDIAMPALAIGRASGSTLRTATEAPALPLAFPDARIIAVEPRGKRSLVRIELHSPRGARVMRLRFGASFDPRLVSVGDVAIDGMTRANGVISLHTVPPEGVVVGVEIDSDAQGSEFAIDDETPGLPSEGQRLLAARGADSAPIHRGDRTLLTSLRRVPDLRASATP